MVEKNYQEIVSHYEDCLERHGDSHLGVDWPKKEDAETRYRVMLEVIRQPRSGVVSLLDFGCGTSHLQEYILARGIDNIQYSGLDISEKFIQFARDKFPGTTYLCGDVLDDKFRLPKFDYIIMNGVFTEKRSLSFDEMLAYFKQVVRRVFSQARQGIAFNAMSKQVDWERADLFHLPLDTLAEFSSKELTRNFVIRNDYGLYEYTTYVYR